MPWFVEMPAFVCSGGVIRPRWGRALVPSGVPRGFFDTSAMESAIATIVRRILSVRRA